MNEHGEHTQSHIDLIAKQEHEFLSQRRVSEWIGDRVATFAGSIYFVLLHAIIVLFWIVINGGRVSGIPKFDPYPYSLLGTIVAIEAVFPGASRHYPLGKAGRGCRSVMAYLVSPAAKWMTGSSVRMDGGEIKGI